MECLRRKGINNEKAGNAGQQVRERICPEGPICTGTSLTNLPNGNEQRQHSDGVKNAVCRPPPRPVYAARVAAVNPRAASAKPAHQLTTAHHAKNSARRCTVGEERAVKVY